MLKKFLSLKKGVQKYKQFFNSQGNDKVFKKTF